MADAAPPPGGGGAGARGPGPPPPRPGGPGGPPRAPPGRGAGGGAQPVPPTPGLVVRRGIPLRREVGLDDPGVANRTRGEAPPDQPDTLGQPGQPRPTGQAGGPFRRSVGQGVGDRDADAPRRVRQAQHHPAARGGITQDVRDRLGEDATAGGCHERVEDALHHGRGVINGEAVGPQRPDGGKDALYQRHLVVEFVDQPGGRVGRRPQAVQEDAQFVEPGPGRQLGVREHPPQVGHLVCLPVTEDAHQDERQLVAHHVVQVPGDPAAHVGAHRSLALGHIVEPTPQGGTVERLGPDHHPQHRAEDERAHRKHLIGDHQDHEQAHPDVPAPARPGDGHDQGEHESGQGRVLDRGHGQARQHQRHGQDDPPARSNHGQQRPRHGRRRMQPAGHIARHDQPDRPLGSRRSTPEHREPQRRPRQGHEDGHPQRSLLGRCLGDGYQGDGHPSRLTPHPADGVPGVTSGHIRRPGGGRSAGTRGRGVRERLGWHQVKRKATP